jgi:hypothetical protein
MIFRRGFCTLLLLLNAFALHYESVGRALSFPQLEGDKLVAWAIFITGTTIIWCMPDSPKS